MSVTRIPMWYSSVAVKAYSHDVGVMADLAAHGPLPEHRCHVTGGLHEFGDLLLAGARHHTVAPDRLAMPGLLAPPLERRSPAEGLGHRLPDHERPVVA